MYEFAIMSYEDFDKLKKLYTELIEIVCNAKESDTMEEKIDLLLATFYKVSECLNFSPYTHFYTQVLIDIIVKTYNTKVFRSDLLLKSQIDCFIENEKYYPNEFYEDWEENEYTIHLITHEFTQKVEKISKKQHKEYMEFFETIKDLLVKNFMEKKADLKDRLEQIYKYSNNSIVKSLSTEERLFLYEAKRVFDIHYLNTNPAHALFLDTKFKTKYICDKELSMRERTLDVEEIVKLMKTKNMKAEQVYELENTEEQIRFELFKVIQNNFSINKCENCGRLFIPITSSNNKNQKGRNDQKYCNNLYLNTGKTCKEIGALNKQKEKVQNSPILIEYNREYKRMHGLHYNHQKKFTEKKFKEWSKKARKLRNNFTDNQLEEFKMELKKLSDMYWK
ncbi:MAG: hypothetical protein J6K42_00495 [Clostridia bacterium]|nr:hypothetical protein [Clostridia bacterium]